MIQRNQLIEGCGPENDLLTVGGPQPRGSGGGCGRGWKGLGCRSGRRLEERGLFGARRFGIVWVFHEEMITMDLSPDNIFWDNRGFFHRLSVDLVKKLMEKTTTKTGLQVTVDIFPATNPTGVKAPADFKETRAIVFDEVLPKWNYRALPHRLES